MNGLPRLLAVIRPSSADSGLLFWPRPLRPPRGAMGLRRSPTTGRLTSSSAPAAAGCRRDALKPARRDRQTSGRATPCSGATGSTPPASTTSRADVARRRAARAGGQPAGYLRTLLVGKATAKRYTVAVEGFEEWARGRTPRADLNDSAAVDDEMEKYFEHLYWDGAAPAAGRMVLFGWLWVRRLGRGIHLLPRSRDALRGWTKGAPEGARSPCPWIAALLGARTLAAWGPDGVVAARAGLLQFDLYARPSEILNLRVRDVMPPRGRDRKYRHWAVVIAPSRRDDGHEPAPTTKSGEQDVTVLAVDAASCEAGRAWLKDLWAAAVRHKKPNELVFPLPLALYERLWKAAWKANALEGLLLCPHTLRHGGASTDRLLGVRDTAAVQKRGHWKSAASVARYEKHGTLLRQRRKIPETLLTQEAAISTNVHTLLRKV